MPISQRDGKWYWGKQGPFDSRKKAEKVAQAAYSSGYTKKGSDASSLGSSKGWQTDSTPLTADELARKEGRAVQKFGPSQFGPYANRDALERGSDEPEGWKEEDEDEEESAVKKLVKRTVKITDRNMPNSVNDSSGHPGMPSNYQGKLGAKRIDWRKKKNPDFEKLVRGGTPTHSVYSSSMDTNAVQLKKELWLSKFIDISRQRVIAYILKEDEEGKESSSEPEQVQPSSGEEDTPMGTPLQWDTETMGPLPPNRIEIESVEEAPKGTRIIEGPRGGLYYIGDPLQSTNIEHRQYGDTFNRVRKKFMRHEKAIEQAEWAYQTALNSQSFYLDSHKDLKGLQKGSGEYLDALRKIKDEDEWYKDRQAEIDDAYKRYDRKVQQSEPIQIEGIKALLKIFATSPEIDGIKIPVSPDIKLRYEEAIEGTEMLDSYGASFELALKDQATNEFLAGEPGNPTLADLTDEQRKEMRTYVYEEMKRQNEGRQLGGAYTASRNDIILNPHTTKGLFGTKIEDYMEAIHAITHEVFHSANRDRDRYAIFDKMRYRIKGMRVEDKDGSHDIFQNKFMGKDDMHRYWNTSEPYQRFINECPTEILTLAALNKRYKDKDGKSKSAKTYAEASKLAMPAGDAIGGYKSIMPTFAKWALLKNNNSPKAARKDIARVFSEEDTNVLFNDFIHFLAVGSISNTSGKYSGPGYSSKQDTTDPTATGLRTSARHVADSFMGNFVKVDTDRWANADKTTEAGGLGPRVDGVDMEDYLKYNLKDEKLNTVASINDVKWLLYGEQDNE